MKYLIGKEDKVTEKSIPFRQLHRSLYMQLDEELNGQMYCHLIRQLYVPLDWMLCGRLTRKIHQSLIHEVFN